jgi:hypothetical protein
METYSLHLTAKGMAEYGECLKQKENIQAYLFTGTSFIRVGF